MSLYTYFYQQRRFAFAQPLLCNIIVRRKKHNLFANDFDIFTHQLLTNNL